MYASTSIDEELDVLINIEISKNRASHVLMTT
jgi:hypothetical protein